MADLFKSRGRDAGCLAAAVVRRSLDLQHGYAVEEIDPDHGDGKSGTGDGCDQRAQSRHLLERRSEYQLHHLRSDRFHVLSAARGAVRGTLHILMPPLWEQVSGARVYDLGQPYFTGMPHWPAHPPFLFGLTKRHGDTVGPAGNSSAADAMALGSHVGTHIDALCHFSRGGMLHGGHAVERLQSYGGGLEKFSVDTIAPILRRGVLLDVARVVAGDVAGGAEGAAPLPEDCEITPEQLEAACKTEIRHGDVVLLRTGWARYVERARNLCGGQRHGGVREIAGRVDAGACPLAGGERRPHHRVFESGGTGGGRRDGVPVRGRAHEDSGSHRSAAASAGSGGQGLT